MPVKISSELPAFQALAEENIFVMDLKRAVTQDIRPLEIAILNLMPTKIVTETQLLRLLSNSPLQIEITLLSTASHQSKNTSAEHLDMFYKTFDSIRHRKFDGLIITGAPVELLEFDEVDYWQELAEIMAWSRTNVYSTMHICWAAQAGLYYHYGIAKRPVDQKVFGVFDHTISNPKHCLMRGFDDTFLAPHSRHTTISRQEVLAVPELELLAESERAGVFIVASRDGRQVFVTGHAEYDADSLDMEYRRDISKGMEISPPENYYRGPHESAYVHVCWRAHANLLYANWLNYFVYQQTPYVIEQIS